MKVHKIIQGGYENGTFRTDAFRSVSEDYS